MKPAGLTPEPGDAAARRAVSPVVCYPVERLPGADLALLDRARAGAIMVERVVVPPREGRVVRVPAGALFQIVCMEGAQVGDLNIWNADDLSEHFYAGKTRALHGTHVGRGDRLWSTFPALRPLATIVWDSLDWYGFDAFGGGVHDVIGTRCDPYTNRLLGGGDYHHCCHSNLTRALADATGFSIAAAEPLVHDVLNVFMCTGFTADTHQYFMKATPARAGDVLTLFAEIDLLVGLSACPGGDCGAEHSSDAARCSPLAIEVLRAPDGLLAGWRRPERSAYGGGHGRGAAD